MLRTVSSSWLRATPGCLFFLNRQLSSTASPGFIELREYTMKPEGYAEYIRNTSNAAQLRKDLLPFLGMFTCDVGGCLHRVVHFYSYQDYDHRDEVRGRAVNNPEWKKYIEATRPTIQYQENKVLLEAAPVYTALQIPSAASYQSPQGAKTKVVYEMRTYQLHPGYGSVPKLVEAFKNGLPAKVEADHEGRLVLFAHSDVGMLNHVIELWRYPSAQACIRARQASRAVASWRETIAAVTPSVQHFTSAFLHPTTFSPWQ